MMADQQSFILASFLFRYLERHVRRNPTIGFGRIWSDWSDLVGFGRIGRIGWIWLDLVGFGRIWSVSV